MKISILKAQTFLENAPITNPKPVVEHSKRMAERLKKYGYKEEVVTAALLHDLIEDAGVSPQTIKRKFGQKIADLVSAVSFNPKIKDYRAKYQEMFERTKKAGLEALVIKAADILDNNDYFDLIESPQKRKEVLRKMKYFVEISEDKIGKEKIYRDLAERYLKLKRNTEI